MWTTHPTKRSKSYDGQSKLIDIIQCNSLLRTLSDETIDHIGCNYCHCSYAHKSAICSSKFLKITNMPPIASLQFTHLAFCAGTNKNRRNSFPLLVDNFYFVGDIRRQSQTSPQQFTASTSQFASTKMSTPRCNFSQFPIQSRHFKVHCEQNPIKTSVIGPNQPARCTDAKL